MNNKLLIFALIAAVAALLLVGLPQRPAGPVCPGGGEVTPIHTIQGAGPRSPLVGQSVTVSGVVVGDFQGKDRLNGFFLQEEDRDADSDPNTSEGIFVYDRNNPVDVRLGDLVCVTGTVAEYKGLTEIKDVTQVTVRGRAPLPSAAQVTLPLANEDALESVEGMRVFFPQRLTVTDVYNLGRYGEVTLSSHRLFAPTEIAAPGSDAAAVAHANAMDRIVLDDGSSTQNPDPIPYPPTGLSASDTLRDGDAVQGVQGVITYSYGSYLIEPITTPEFLFLNPRSSAPAPVGGTLRVASFNVENYFNGDGCGSGFPTARGAVNLREYARQQDKLVKALVGLRADVLGLAEIENDGYGPASAIHALVAGMNAAAPVGTSYDYVRFDADQIGTDQITCAIVYRTQTVAPAGKAAFLTAGLPEMNRPPLAQTFVQRDTGAEFTVVMNHFKSKSPRGAYGEDADQGDGQGAWNHNRTEAAKALLHWLATAPTGTDDPDYLIIGDLNSYTREDPVTTILSAGYVDLVSRFGDGPNYTYVYKGEAGCLDHALASTSLARQATGAEVWHIDADEPPVLGYGTAYKSADQLVSLYRNDPYRSSDHDPIVIGFDLR